MSDSESPISEARPDTPSKSGYIRRNRVALTVLLLIVAAGIGWYFRSTWGKPERVLAMPPADSFVGVAGGSPIFRASAGRMTLYAVDPKTGRKRAIVRGEQGPTGGGGGAQALGAEGQQPVVPTEDPELARANVSLIPGRVSPAIIESGEIFLVGVGADPNSPRGGGANPPGPGPGSMTMGPGGPGPGGPGTPGPAPNAAGGRKLTRSDLGGAQTVAVPNAVTLYRIPAAGGEPVVVAKGGSGFTRAGKQLYWIVDHEWVNLPSAARPGNESGGPEQPVLPPSDELMTASLDGGEPRKIGVQLADRTRLISGTDGIFWLDQESAGRPVLSYLRNGSSSPARLENFSSIANPVDLGGRVYWLEEEAIDEGSVNQPANPEIILKEAPADLASAQDIHRFTLRASQKGGRIPALSGGGVFPGLAVHDGRIYAVLMDGTPEAGVRPPKDAQDISPESRPRLSLFRLETTSKPSFKRLATLPPDSRDIGFEGGYCYFIAPDYGENWLDWSNTGLQTQSTPTLYRYRVD